MWSEGVGGGGRGWVCEVCGGRGECVRCVEGGGGCVEGFHLQQILKCVCVCVCVCEREVVEPGENQVKPVGRKGGGNRVTCLCAYFV